MNPVEVDLGSLSPEEKRKLLAKLLREKANRAHLAHPMTPVQRALWFMCQLDRDTPTYNLAFTARVVSPVDAARMREVFQVLVDRHVTLRTTYNPNGGDPCMEIHKSMPVAFEEVDAAGWSEEGLLAEVHRRYAEPLNLETGPILRVQLFTRAPADRILLLVVHHIACDGLGMIVLLSDFCNTYCAHLAGRGESAAAPPFQYTDYVRKHAEMLAGEEGAKHWAYWREQLAGDLPDLQLPTDRPRLANARYRSGHHVFEFADPVRRKLESFARAEGTTMFTLLLATYQLLLSRYTGQDDVLVGVPMAGRGWLEYEAVVGHFVNMVVMRGDLSGNPTFREFLARSHRALRGAVEHQDYPFPLLVQQLQPTRDISRTPIFRVTLNLVKQMHLDATASLIEGRDCEETVQWGDMVLKPYPVPRQEEPFDLAVKLLDTGKAMFGEVQYDSGLFEPETIDRFARSWKALLADIAERPDSHISHLAIFSRADYQQVVRDWNATAAEYPHEACIHQLFEAQAEQTPAAVAAVFQDRQLTYEELNQWVNRVAHLLRRMGVGPETLVGISVERSLEMLVGIYGILKAGAAYVPLDPAFPEDRLSYMLADACTPVLLSQRSLRERFSGYQGRIVCLDGDAETIDQQPSENCPCPARGEDLAYVIYTSGSTGQPKGVMIPHRCVVNLLCSMRRQLEVTQRDVLLAVTTLSFDIAGLELLLPLSIGAQVVIAPWKTVADAAALRALLADSGATVMQAAPVTWQMLVEGGWRGTPPLKILCGGEALPPDLAEALLGTGGPVWNLYGPTETTIWSTTCRITSLERPISIGRPIDNTEIYVLDRHLQPVPVGALGELLIGGAGLARGYLNRPELTAEKFILNPFSDKPGARLYRTGDWARYRPEGTIECAGRIDHQVEIRGFRIEPGEIEAALRQHPAVREAVVLAREDSPGDKRLAAYLVPGEGQSVAIAELKHQLRQVLPEYMVPAAFVILAELPRTPNGKVDRRRLPAAGQARPDTAAGYVAPRTPTEETLAAIWSEILKIDRVSVHDNFFELGGHSLLATRVIARVRQAFDVNIELQNLFEDPTVAGLAESLEMYLWAAKGSDGAAAKHRGEFVAGDV